MYIESKRTKKKYLQMCMKITFYYKNLGLYYYLWTTQTLIIVSYNVQEIKDSSIILFIAFSFKSHII